MPLLRNEKQRQRKAKEEKKPVQGTGGCQETFPTKFALSGLDYNQVSVTGMERGMSPQKVKLLGQAGQKWQKVKDCGFLILG